MGSRMGSPPSAPSLVHGRVRPCKPRPPSLPHPHQPTTHSGHPLSNLWLCSGSRVCLSCPCSKQCPREGHSAPAWPEALPPVGPSWNGPLPVLPSEGGLPAPSRQRAPPGKETAQFSVAAVGVPGRGRHTSGQPSCSGSSVLPTAGWLAPKHGDPGWEPRAFLPLPLTPGPGPSLPAALSILGLQARGGPRQAQGQVPQQLRMLPSAVRGVAAPDWPMDIGGVAVGSVRWFSFGSRPWPRWAVGSVSRGPGASRTPTPTDTEAMGRW